MHFGAISGQPLSVAEAISRAEIIGELVAVHGVLYYGISFDEGFVCLPKVGPFDGTGHDFTKGPPDPSEVLLVDEPLLYERLKAANFEFGVGGAAVNNDAVIFGMITSIGGRVRIADLLLAVVQRAANPEVYMRHWVYVINFGDGRMPKLPYAGRSWPDEFVPSVEVFPVPRL